MILEFFILKQKVRKLIQNTFSDEKEKTLDLGCGENPFYHDDMKSKVVAFDLRKTNKSHVVGDAGSIPFKKNSFESIISINSFYYFNNPFVSAQEMSRVLKKNGRIFVMMPFIYPVHDAPFDKFRFTEYGLREVFEKDFEIAEIGTIGGIFNIPAVMLHSIIKGMKFILPKPLRFLSIISTIILWPIYIIAQIISILDVFDRTRRWPTYYYLVAIKK